MEKQLFPILLLLYIIHKQSLVIIFIDKAFLVILETRHNRENIILLAFPSPEGTILDEKHAR